MSYAICDDCKYVKYSFDGGSTKCGYRGKKDCNFTPRENKGSEKDKERARATDNEITKGMECVIGNDVNCSECAYQKVLPFPSCRRMRAKNALDLINRQKAENESLKVDLAKFSIRLDNLYKTANEIKSEAIKEFVHRLKDKVVQKYKYTDIRIFEEIENLVKEMTEVSE